MPVITFEDFSVGKDLRKGASVADANRMRDLINAYVTTGKAIQKRPGTVKITTLEPGTKGLISANGYLNTFYESGSISHTHALFRANMIDHGTIGTPVSKIHFGDTFQGFMYIVAEYLNGDIRHHYFDTTPTLVTDANCPNTAAARKLESKIFAVNGDVVRFSKSGDARDWTTPNDAGFLPTGLKQAGNENALALGQFQKNGLIVFFPDFGSQYWTVDPDPALHVFEQTLPGTITKYPRTVVPLFQDLYFLNDSGFRSISQEVLTESQAELDVGSPIDPDIQAALPATVEPFGALNTKYGQYWGKIDDQIFVFTLSKTAKITAWSVYTYHYTIDDIAELNGEMYFRSGDDIYMVDRNATNDDGTLFKVTVDMPFVNAKKPGILKQWWGMDSVSVGTANIQYRWNPNNPTLLTNAIPLSGDTRPGDITPVELQSTSIAPLITHEADEDFRLDSLSLYYNELGPV